MATYRRGKGLSAIWPSAFTLSLLVAGCTTDHRRQSDPLLGGQTPVTTPAALGKPAPGPPPLQSASPTSTAAVASGSSGPLATRGDLRIGDPLAAKTQDGPQAMLHQPEAGNRPNMTLTGNTPPAALTSTQQAQQLVANRGARWQRLEMTPDQREWKFSCAMPSRQYPNLNRTYEAHAPTALTAVQLVLEQIDREGN
jgi:hypothetical protein